MHFYYTQWLFELLLYRNVKEKKKQTENNLGFIKYIVSVTTFEGETFLRP